MNTFTVYSDPGHGWVKIPKVLLRDIDLDNKISSFSYQRNKFAYLEEDCDLPLFISRMKELGRDVKFKVQHADRTSKLRNYNPYK